MAKAGISPSHESQTSGGSTNTPLNSNQLWEGYQQIERTPAQRRFGEFTLWCQNLIAQHSGRGTSQGGRIAAWPVSTTEHGQPSTTGETTGQGTTGRTRRKMSAAGRARIAEAQKRRWAEKQGQETQAQPAQATATTKRKAPRRAKTMAAGANSGE